MNFINKYYNYNAFRNIQTKFSRAYNNGSVIYTIWMLIPVKSFVVNYEY